MVASPPMDYLALSGLSSPFFRTQGCALGYCNSGPSGLKTKPEGRRLPLSHCDCRIYVATNKPTARIHQR